MGDSCCVVLTVRVYDTSGNFTDSPSVTLSVANANPKHYEPSNITFGIMPPPASTSGGRAPKKKADRKVLYAERALAALDGWIRSAAAVGAAAATE